MSKKKVGSWKKERKGREKKRAAKAIQQQAQLAFAEVFYIYAGSVQLKNKGREDDSGFFKKNMHLAYEIYVMQTDVLVRPWSCFKRDFT